MSLTDEDKLWIVERMDTLERRLTDRLTGQIEAAETKLLTAFHEWASPAEKRLYSYRATIEAIDAEIERLKLRVERLETPPKPH
jgi:hypothetical protein